MHVRREDGFTLVELLVALVIGLVIFMGAMEVMSVMFRHSTGVVQRTDAAQRGRLALDQMTRELRSQTCSGDPAVSSRVVSGSNGNTVTFYANLGNGPEKHTLTFDPAKGGSITDYVTKGVPQSSTQEVYSYTGTPAKHVLLDHVQLFSGSPFLAYFAYPPNPPDTAEPSVPLDAGGSLTLTDAGRVARIQLTFRVLPVNVSASQPGTAQRDVLDQSTVLQDEVAVRLADPSQDNPNPFLCS